MPHSHVGRDASPNEDLLGLEGDAIIDLFELDLLPLTTNSALRYFRFCNWIQTDGSNVRYNNNDYQPIPVALRGFELKGDGTPPAPSVTVSNIGLDFTALANDWNDLVGAKFIRRRVLRKHLDDGTNPSTTDHWPDEIWFIEQKTEETKVTITFSLSTAFDLDGVALPRRRALRHTCPWVYRGPECGYTGPPVADVYDSAVDLTTHTEGIVYTTASTAFSTARTNHQTALQNLVTAEAALETAKSTYVLLEQRYNSWNMVTTTDWNNDNDYDYDYWNRRSYNSEYTDDARWNGGYVSLGTTYRKGAQVSSYSRDNDDDYWSSSRTTTYHYIERWGISTTAINNAQAAVNTAKTAYQQAETALISAEATYNSAKNTYVSYYEQQTNDYNDKCGKRLSSCRLRFFNPETQEYGALPFGGFPGLSLG